MIVKFGTCTHLWRLFARAHIFRGFRPHIISKPTLYLMCLKLAGSFDSYRLFDLIYSTKLWHFWKFLLEGLVEIWTTWIFSCPTFIRFPIGTCMTPNLQKCRLKKTQGHSTQFQRWWHPQTHHPSVNTPFWALQLHMHGCTILCAYLCWHSYGLRGKCIHFWKCVGLCKWTCAQVGDTHLQGATPFLHVAVCHRFTNLCTHWH